MFDYLFGSFGLQGILTPTMQRARALLGPLLLLLLLYVFLAALCLWADDEPLLYVGIAAVATCSFLLRGKDEKLDAEAQREKKDS